MFSLICTWIFGWVNNGEAGDLRRYRTHYDVGVMSSRGQRQVVSNVPLLCIELIASVSLFLLTNWKVDCRRYVQMSHYTTGICYKHATCLAMGHCIKYRSCRVIGFRSCSWYQPCYKPKVYQWYRDGTSTWQWTLICTFRVVNICLISPYHVRCQAITSWSNDNPVV